MKSEFGFPAGTGPNWAVFYPALMKLGPAGLRGIPQQWQQWFRDEGSEWFWSEHIADSLFVYWNYSPHQAVEQAFSHYVDAVRSGLTELPVAPGVEGWAVCPSTGRLQTWEESINQINGKITPELVDALLEAALTAEMGDQSQAGQSNQVGTKLTGRDDAGSPI